MKIIKHLREVWHLCWFSRFSRKKVAIFFVLVSALSVLGAMADSVGISMLFPLLQSGGTSALGSVPWIGPYLKAMPLSLTQALLLVGVFLGVRALTDFFTPLTIDWFQRDLLRALRSRVSEATLLAPLLEVEKMRVGEVSNRISVDAPRATSYIGSFLRLGIWGFMVLTYVVMLFSISAKVALVGLVSAAPLVMLLLWLYGKISETTVRSNRIRDENNKRIVERLSQARMVKTLGTEQEEIVELNKQYDIWNTHLFHSIVYQSIGKASFTVLPLLGVLIMAALVAFTPSIVSMFLTTLAPMAFIAVRLFAAAGHLNECFITMKTNQDSISLLLDHLRKSESGLRAAATARVRIHRIDSVEFRQVSFSYGSSCPLRSASFKLDKETPIFLRGVSGGGKSTLANLLRGVLHPTSGEILVNGENVLKINPENLKSQIGYMTQESYLFHGTLRENLLYGNRRDVSDAAIIDMLDRCVLRELVESLPGKLDYVLTERGSVVSGGERQRISLARILLRQPSLLILDEATTNMDPETKRIILETLESVSRECLCFVISHDRDVVLPRFKNYELRDGEVIVAQSAIATQ